MPVYLGAELLVQRQYRLDDEPALGAVRDRAAPAQLGGPLAHGRPAHPVADGVAQPLAVIRDGHGQRAVDRDLDRASAGEGMFGDVGHCFRGDPVGGHLDGGWNQRQGLRACDDVLLGLGGQGLGTLSYGADQADLVDRRRAKVVDDPSDLADGVLGLLANLGEELVALALVVSCRGRVQLEHHGGQGGPEAVVQVAT